MRESYLRISWLNYFKIIMIFNTKIEKLLTILKFQYLIFYLKNFGEKINLSPKICFKVINLIEYYFCKLKNLLK